jgi:hypothetical protein
VFRFSTLSVGFLVGTLALATAPTNAASDSTPDVTDLRPGQVERVAGTGRAVELEDGDPNGDGGDARDAMLGFDLEVEVTPDGTIYILDESNEALRVVNTDGAIASLKDAVIKTTPDGDDRGPVATAMADDGTLYISNKNVIRKLETGGESSTANPRMQTCTFAR